MQDSSSKNEVVVGSRNGAEPEKLTLKKDSASRKQIVWITKIGILSAVAIILMYLEFSLPIFPIFLKFDFGDIPALLGAFSMGPLAGVLIQLIKNIAHIPVTHTMMVGELANFIMGSIFVGTAGLIYKYKKTRGGAIVSLIAATIALTISGALINYYLTIPFYVRVLGMTLEDIVAMTRAVGNTMVTDLRSLIVFAFVPFNILKGAVISLIVGIFYKRLSPILHK